MFEYICYYCSYKCTAHHEIIGHACSRHPSQAIHYRKVTLNPENGKFGYSRILYSDLIPLELERSGKAIRSENSNVIVVTLQSENTPHSKKKTRAATPLKEHLGVHERYSLRKLNFDTESHVQNQSDNAMNDQVLKYPSDKQNEVVFRESDNNLKENQPDNEVQENLLDIQNEQQNRHINDTDLEELYTLLPNVVENLRNEGHLESYKKYCKLLSEGKFPYENICYLLFLDLIEWYSQDSSTFMRYKFSDTLQFWRIGYKLFKGKFLRFMSGPKSCGHIIGDTESRGKFSPEESQVNFIVPSFQIIADKANTEDDLLPGIIKLTLDNAEESLKGKPLKLAVDGKKISRGRGKTMGDIDCWGFEAAPTLKEQKERLHHETTCLQSLFDQIDAPSKSNMKDLEEFRSHTDSLIPDLQIQVQNVGKRLNDLRSMLLSTERTIDKFTRIAGENWRTSKFFPLIASLRTTKYDVEKHIEDGLLIVNHLCYYGAVLNNVERDYCQSGAICIDSRNNYAALNTFQGDITDPEQWRYINQRSDAWFELRRRASVTGSTMNAACGLDTLKKQQEHFDAVVFNKPRADFSRTQKENMEFGVENEINAVATTISKIMPLYYPNLIMFEEGCRGIMVETSPFMIVSPDGSLRASKDSEPTLMYETKCKPPKDNMMPVYYRLPKYYVLQVLSEMKAYNCDKLLFTCWSPKSTVALEVTFSQKIWQQAWDVLVLTFNPTDRKRPIRVSAVAKDLRSKVIEFSDTSCTFLGEFPSVKTINQASANTTIINHLHADVDSVLKDIRCLKRWYEEAHELTRKEATEILVFMLSDLDRHFQLEKENALPIAYAMKGPSLKHEVFSKMMDFVIKECEKRGLTICVTSADGQWHKYGIRDSDNKPLTKHQLQRDIFEKFRKAQKNDIIRQLKEINNVDPAKLMEHVAFEKSDNQIVIHGHYLYKCTPKLRSGVSIKSKRTEDKSVTGSPQDNAPELVDNVLQDIGETIQSLDAGMIDTLDSTESSIHSYPHTAASVSDLTDTLGEALQVLYQDPVSSLFADNDIELGLFPLRDETTATVEELGAVEMMNIEGYTMEPVSESKDNDNVQDSHMSKSVLSHDVIVKMKNEMSRMRMPKRPDWGAMGFDDFIGRFQTASRINESFIKTELLCCLREVSGNLKSQGIKCKLSSSKTELVNLFSKVLGDNSEVHVKRRNVSSPKTLRLLSAQYIRDNYSKDCLNSILSEYEWNSVGYANWRYEHDADSYTLSESFGCDIDWFSVPSVDHDKVRFHFTDPSHILTCLRTKLCTTGIKGLNIQAWETAALSKDTNLNISLIVECIDKQSVAFAKAVFANDVQKAMRCNKFENEANFCKLICSWFEAEDAPGIPAIERCQCRLRLREWLLDGVDFGVFPPRSSYIKGIPIIIYEALLTHLERKIQMYAYATEGYNVRSVGTLEVEQFFGTFRDIDPSGVGTPRPDDIPRMMARVADVTNCRMDPNRKFYVKTSKATVYPEVVYETPSIVTDLKWQPASKHKSYILEPRDHCFDGQGRIRAARKKKKTDTISSPRKPSLGVRGVRTYHAMDGSKILDFYKRNLRAVP